MSDSEVLIRCAEPRDAIQLLCKHSIQVDRSQMRLHRWSTKASYNPNLLALWCSLISLPPHLASLPALESILRPWGTVIAVAEDARFLTRPEVVRVCLEFDVSRAPPNSFFLHCLAGEIKVQVILDRFPLICDFCKLLGHEEGLCRTLARRRRRPTPRNEADGLQNVFNRKAVKNERGAGSLGKKDNNSIAPPDPFQSDKANISNTFVLWRKKSEVFPTKASARVEFPKGEKLPQSAKSLNENAGKNGESQVVEIYTRKKSETLPAEKQTKESNSAKISHQQESELVELNDKVMRETLVPNMIDPGGSNPIEKANIGKATENVGNISPAASCPSCSKVPPSQLKAEEKTPGNIVTNSQGEEHEQQGESESFPASEYYTTDEDIKQSEEEFMEESNSPAASDIQITPFKPWGPMLWSSMAGDIHINYAMCNEKVVEDNLSGIPFDRRPNIPTKGFDNPITFPRLKRVDPKFKCGSCDMSMVALKGSMCRICNFQGRKKRNRKRILLSPPKYIAKSEECFFIKTRADKWEEDAKKELLEIADTEIRPLSIAATEKKDSPPQMADPSKMNKVKWGDIPTDEEYSAEDKRIGNDAFKVPPRGRGKKINSRIDKSTANEPRKTRSGKKNDNIEDGKSEMWLEGIRLLKVKRYDQRHNATWFQWEVAPDVVISRRQKKRIENIAQKSESR